MRVQLNIIAWRSENLLFTLTQDCGARTKDGPPLARWTLSVMVDAAGSTTPF